MFISFEGIEGVGKSTQLALVADYLRHKGHDIVVTHEPGGTPLSDSIRQLLLQDHQEDVHSDTELLLMFASRAQHIAQVIKPALTTGKVVLSDRFTDASYAYQGGGRGIDMTRIAQLEQWLETTIYPDLTVLLDAPVEVALARMRRRGQLDRIESQAQAFFERVRAVYLERANKYPERFCVVNVTADIKTCKTKVVNVIDSFLRKKK